MNKFARIPSTAQLRALEASWIELCHKDWGLVLMELAGRRSAERAKEMWDKHSGLVTIFCGGGNNGGDGLVVARYLRLWNVPVTVYMVAVPQKKSAQARNEGTINKEVVEKLGLEIHSISENDLPAIAKTARDSAMIVDALLGTGLDRKLEGIYLHLVDLINDCKRPVLSIDIPTGINSDTGQKMGAAVHADETVTFGYLKAGLLNFPGADCAGKITLVDIGLPDIGSFDNSDKSRWYLTTAGHVRGLLPVRPVDSNKGTFGSVLTIAGSMNYRGAAALAAFSALRVGAGLCQLAAPKSVIPQLPVGEVVYKSLEETKSAGIAVAAVEQLKDDLVKAAAVILGPGLGLDPETVAFVQKLLPSIEKPCIIDADALNAIAKNISMLPRNKGYVLTPHPKEFSRLTAISTEDIHSNRIAVAAKAAFDFGCVIVLKGAHTIIASPEGDVFINPTGNAGMATAGCGDVLSGIIGGLLAQGLKPMDAAVAGTYIHGLAGDIAMTAIGETGYLAGDIASFVPEALSRLHEPEYSGSHLELSALANS